MKRRTERSRPASTSLRRANAPGFMAWSTTEVVADLDLINWALTCWASLADRPGHSIPHCTLIEITDRGEVQP